MSYGGRRWRCDRFDVLGRRIIDPSTASGGGSWRRAPAALHLPACYCRPLFRCSPGGSAVYVQAPYKERGGKINWPDVRSPDGRAIRFHCALAGRRKQQTSRVHDSDTHSGFRLRCLLQGSADSNYSQPSSDLSLDDEREALRRETERLALAQLEKARVRVFSLSRPRFFPCYLFRTFCRSGGLVSCAMAAAKPAGIENDFFSACVRASLSLSLGGTLSFLACADDVERSAVSYPLHLLRRPFSIQVSHYSRRLC